MVHLEPEPIAGGVTLLDDDPRWQRHTGGAGHHAFPEWDENDDLAPAQAFYSGVTGKARVILDLLIDHPGRPLSVAEIREHTGGLFADARAVAGSLGTLDALRKASGRRYPFYWWAARAGETSYAMKRGVAHLFRRAQAVPAMASSGVAYRPPAEDVEVAPATPAAPADPDSWGAGLRAHMRLQNRLARLVEERGFVPLSPGPGDPEYDLAWTDADGMLVVVEVKSTQAGNEVRQLRLGLGQVLDYRGTLTRRRLPVRAVLYVEREPAEAERWTAIAGDAGVTLGWPGTEVRLGVIAG